MPFNITNGQCAMLQPLWGVMVALFYEVIDEAVSSRLIMIRNIESFIRLNIRVHRLCALHLYTQSGQGLGIKSSTSRVANILFLCKDGNAATIST